MDPARTRIANAIRRACASKRRRWPALLVAIALVSSAPAIAVDAGPTTAVTADHAELKRIYEADQADRLGDALKDEPEAVLARDKARRDRTLALVKAGELRTPDDYFRAAMVFQHSAEDIRLAHALSTVASYLAPNEKKYRWLIAASWDRMLMQQVQPQWYGTQYRSDKDGLYLFPVAEGAVSDAEREAMGVPPLAEARARVPDMAKTMGQQPRKQAPSIETLQAEAREPAASKAQP